MNSNNLLHYFFRVLLASIVILTGCDRAATTEGASTSADADQAPSAGEFERGPHNGRLLRDGALALEIAIFEDGVAPEFRVYASDGKQPIAPADLQLTVEVHRFADVVDQLQFAARDGYLASTTAVYEPHSFDIVVLANYRGKAHRWSYASYEGRTTIDAAAAKAAGIEVAAAGPGAIEERIELYGTIQPDATRVRAVAARFPGAIRSIDVAVGERVRAGQRLAQVESNESLQTYAVTAPIAGLVTQRRGNPGETTDTAPLFEIADHSQVWAVVNIFPRDRSRIGIGQAIGVQAADGETRGQGVIAAISTAGAGPAAIMARVVLDNRSNQWTPGQLVNAQVTTARFDAPVVVPLAALQRYRDGDAVFLNRADGYQAQPVELGRRDGRYAEITGGLAAGMQVVVANSYLVKADIEKSGASHDH
jgi:cobalt-zinc-cadmium efflux system membrane fusion protein